MLLLTALLSILLLFIIVLNYKDNVMITICLHYIGIELFMFFAVLFMGQVYQYPTLFSFDTYLFLTFIKKSFSPYTLAKFILMSHIVIMFANFILLCSLIKRKYTYKSIFLALISLFALLNWPTVKYNITIRSYLYDSQLNIYAILEKITRPFSVVVFFIIIMLPLVLVLVNYKTTYIRYKKFCLNLSVITLSIIVFFEIVTFYVLPTKTFCSFNLDSYSFPTGIYNEYSGFYDVLISPKLIIPMMITLNIALLACLIMSYTKPFKFFIHSDLINVKALKKLDSNILMMFHTYKNAFWGISKLSEQALMYPDSVKDSLTAINNSSTEMFNGICRSIKMLSFSRDNIDTVDLISCIRNVIASNDIGNITFDIKTQYDAVYIKINEGHIMDILQNIVQNSIDAISSKGNDDGKIVFKLYCEPGSVELQITDNGCGIKNSQLKNLFSYFNSTKHGNQHFGIGLIFIKKVIKAYNGHISIKSVYGKYTTVTLLFPLPTKE